MKIIALSILNVLDETQKIQNFSLFEFKKNINKIIDKKFIDYLGFQEELNSVISKYVSKTKQKKYLQQTYKSFTSAHIITEIVNRSIIENVTDNVRIMRDMVDR